MYMYVWKQKLLSAATNINTNGREKNNKINLDMTQVVGVLTIAKHSNSYRFHCHLFMCETKIPVQELGLKMGEEGYVQGWSVML